MSTSVPNWTYVKEEPALTPKEDILACVAKDSDTTLSPKHVLMTTSVFETHVLEVNVKTRKEDSNVSVHKEVL